LSHVSYQCGSRRRPIKRKAIGCSSAEIQLRIGEGAKKTVHWAILRLRNARAPPQMSTMPRISSLSLVTKPPREEEVSTPSEARTQLDEAFEAVRKLVEQWATTSEDVTFRAFEKALVTAVLAVGRAAIVSFLTLREYKVAGETADDVERGGRRFRKAPAIARNLTTMFGVVRYTRLYMREVTQGKRRGFHPLDMALGLLPDRLSWNVLALAVRLATKLSFAEARSTLSQFVPNAPSTEVIEKAVLGLGRYTAEWFEHAPAPDDDGDVLVIMIDSKGAPTATDTELSRRRGKRKKRRLPKSPRHRGRARRGRRPKKPRRKKGDKSKNAKMATMVVMYTLKRHGSHLLGPINRKVYASFAPKKHALVVARREADKRGFGQDSGKLVQLVTDGDQDLACYAKEYLPNALHTMDVMHVIERLWSAGECIHREGTSELQAWVETQKDRLYRGRVDLIVRELRRRFEATPKTGPGNRGKRKRLAGILRYIEKREGQMPYDELIDQDLELGSGSVEGAVKNVIGKRFDHGGMRWIKERAEALLQLRCIEVNGDWDAFIDRVHDQMRGNAIRDGTPRRLQSSSPNPLPSIQEAA